MSEEIIPIYRIANIDVKGRITIRKDEIKRCGFKDNVQVLMCKYKGVKAIMILPLEESLMMDGSSKKDNCL